MIRFNAFSILFCGWLGRKWRCLSACLSVCGYVYNVVLSIIILVAIIILASTNLCVSSSRKVSAYISMTIFLEPFCMLATLLSMPSKKKDAGAAIDLADRQMGRCIMRVYVRACVSVQACKRACVRACVRARVRRGRETYDRLQPLARNPSDGAARLARRSRVGELGRLERSWKGPRRLPQGSIPLASLAARSARLLATRAEPRPSAAAAAAAAAASAASLAAAAAFAAAPRDGSTGSGVSRAYALPIETSVLSVVVPGSGVSVASRGGGAGVARVRDGVLEEELLGVVN